jgi:hypothetical protein
MNLENCFINSNILKHVDISKSVEPFEYTYQLIDYIENFTDQLPEGTSYQCEDLSSRKYIINIGDSPLP